MTKSKGFVAAVLIVSCVAPAVHARARVSPNWMVESIVAGRSGARIYTELEARPAAGKDYVVWGAGYGVNHSWGLAYFGTSGLGAMNVQTTYLAGGRSIPIVPETSSADGSPAAALGWEFNLEPRQRVSFLIFAADNGSVDTTPLLQVTSGSVRVSIFSGTGATAVELTDPGNTQPAVGAAGAGAGAFELSRHVTTPIVGAFADCIACTATWTSRRETLTHTSTIHDGNPPSAGTTMNTASVQFEGPAGDWSWTWQGATLKTNGRPLVLAYMPIPRSLF